MNVSQTEIESIVDSAFEDIVEIGLAGQFTKIKEVEYALDYLKRKIDELEPNDFLN
jgi:hypothetical protein